MAGVVKRTVWCCVFLIFLYFIKTECALYERSENLGPPPEFSRHTTIKPQIFYGREKREITSTKENGGHIQDLTIQYYVNGKNYMLDLQLNKGLIPESYFERYQLNGQHVINKPTANDVELCQYQGKLRGYRNSWAAISTCSGLSGVIFDGEELYFVERESTAEGINGVDEHNEGENGITASHFLYSDSDSTTNRTCGYSGSLQHTSDSHTFKKMHRHKRSVGKIRGPYNASKQSRYVELVLVVDNKQYKELGENIQKVKQYCKDIANIVNSLFMPLNIFIALVGVEVWTEHDEIVMVADGDTTLANFLRYRREKLLKDHPNDNAQLLTRVQFQGGVIAKALKGPICTFEYSGGVNTIFSSVLGQVATSVAHTIGHNLGMEHDTDECVCANERCIMNPQSSSNFPTQWSSCSVDYLTQAFRRGMDYCLRNKPRSLFESPVCGNGFVEAGEQCDCGMKGHCDNPCCNASTCMLYANASCATGECCDLKTCQVKRAGTVCRSADQECDLPEYCTGLSESCPDDVFKMDGETCNKEDALCYKGSCQTHADQCRLLWGPTGLNSHMRCYELNKKGSRHGNCGYNHFNQSYIKCNDEDIYCGLLHCKHSNERLEFGMESVSILSYYFIHAEGSIISCRVAIIDLGLDVVNPGLVPNGAKCGEGKMCMNQKCISVDSLRQEEGVTACPRNCSGNGICNNRGHCHCMAGYAPPLCKDPGRGGSEDSGPTSDPNNCGDDENNDVDDNSYNTTNQPDQQPRQQEEEQDQQLLEQEQERIQQPQQQEQEIEQQPQQPEQEIEKQPQQQEQEIEKQPQQQEQEIEKQPQQQEQEIEQETQQQKQEKEKQPQQQEQEIEQQKQEKEKQTQQQEQEIEHQKQEKEKQTQQQEQEIEHQKQEKEKQIQQQEQEIEHQKQEKEKQTQQQEQEIERQKQEKEKPTQRQKREIERQKQEKEKQTQRQEKEIERQKQEKEKQTQRQEQEIERQKQEKEKQTQRQEQEIERQKQEKEKQTQRQEQEIERQKQEKEKQTQRQKQEIERQKQEKEKQTQRQKQEIEHQKQEKEKQPQQQEQEIEYQKQEKEKQTQQQKQEIEYQKQEKEKQTQQQKQEIEYQKQEKEKQTQLQKQEIEYQKQEKEKQTQQQKQEIEYQKQEKEKQTQLQKQEIEYQKQEKEKQTQLQKQEIEYQKQQKEKQTQLQKQEIEYQKQQKEKQTQLQKQEIEYQKQQKEKQTQLQKQEIEYQKQQKEKQTQLQKQEIEYQKQQKEKQTQLQKQEIEYQKQEKEKQPQQ